MAGQPGSVLRNRIGPHAAAACLEELWKESQGRRSPTVALHGNVPASLPTASSFRQAVKDHVDSDETDGGYRTAASFLILISTSAWIMNKLPVSGWSHPVRLVSKPGNSQQGSSLHIMLFEKACKGWPWPLVIHDHVNTHILLIFTRFSPCVTGLYAFTNACGHFIDAICHHFAMKNPEQLLSFSCLPSANAASMCHT